MQTTPRFLRRFALTVLAGLYLNGCEPHHPAVTTVRLQLECMRNGTVLLSPGPGPYQPGTMVSLPLRNRTVTIGSDDS